VTVRRALAAGLLAALTGGAAAASGASGASGPTAKAEASKAAVGDLVRVTGTGWGPAGSGVVAVKVCGNGAMDPAADCDPSNTAEGAIRDGGSFFLAIRISQPPKPCPCTLLATSDVSLAQVRMAIEIAGVPTAPLQNPVGLRRAVTMTKVKVSGDGPRTSWLVGGGDRTLTVYVKNTGDVTLHDPPIDIAWGRGKNPDGFVRSPSLGDLPPASTRVVKVPVHIPAWSFGLMTVKVEVDPFGTVAVRRVHATLVPWGSVAVALLAAQLVLLALRNQARKVLVPAVEFDAAAPRPPAVKPKPVRPKPVAVTSAGEVVWRDRRQRARRAEDRSRAPR